MAINSSTKQLRAFVAVAKLKSFTAAAERLFVTQSTLTSSMQQFEADIGVKLFDRTTRKVALTAAGEAFLPVATKLLGEFDNAISDLKLVDAGRRGKVRIATTSSAMMQILAPSLRQFTHANAQINLSIKDGVSADVRRMVASGEADFGLGTFSVSDPSLTFTPMLADRMGVVCKAGHPLAQTKRALCWDDLRPYPYVRLMMDAGIGSLIQELPVFDRQIVTHEVSHAGLLDWLLEEKNSFSVASALVAALPAMSGLVFRPLEEPVIERKLGMLRSKDRESSPSAQRFIDCMELTLREAALPSNVRRLIPA